MNEFHYDAESDPPAPVCDVVLIVPATDLRVSAPAIVDTGADGMIVPVGHLHRIGARRVFKTGMRSQWGERRAVYLYLIDVQIGSITLPGVYAVGDELGTEVILGRNVLNRLRVLLDGPAALTRIQV